MQWVETTAKTVEEATAIALDQLGVAADEAEIEVLEEAKTGLFGRVRNDARVRARVRPAKPAGKDDAGRRPERAAGRGRGKTRAEAPKAERPAAATAEPRTERRPAATGSPRPRRDDAEALEAVPAEIDEVGVRFLQGLLAAMGLEGTVTSQVANQNMIEFQVAGKELGVLIGPRAQTLQAIQELLRTVVHYDTGSSSGRVLLDIGNYRAKRRAALTEFTAKVVANVIESGSAKSLEPMSPSDRKVVHDAVNELSGVVSSSEGEEPQRFVVISPA